MAFTIYAKMKRVGKQKKEDLLPVPFELEKRPDTVRELVTALVRLSVSEYNERKGAAVSHERGDKQPGLGRQSLVRRSGRQ